MKMLARGMGVVLVALLTTAFTPPDVAAQRRSGVAGAGQDRADLERRIRARFGQMVRERLGLDDAQAQELSGILQSFQEDRSRLFREEQALRRRVEALLLEGAPESDEAATLVERMSQLRLEEAALFEREQQALLQLLSPTQLLRLHVMREQMGQRIRQLRPGGGGGRRGPGGPMIPGGGPIPDGRLPAPIF